MNRDCLDHAGRITLLPITYCLSFAIKLIRLVILVSRVTGSDGVMGEVGIATEGFNSFDSLFVKTSLIEIMDETVTLGRRRSLIFL